MELADINSVKKLIFECICKTYIVQSPKMADVIIEPRVSLEQLIWTPRRDKTWEVRLGNVNRGCPSPALELLPKMRTKEYEKNKIFCPKN